MIEVRQLRKSFDGQEVLDGISFQIESGESVAIIGRSGGGKSVLLKHLIGLLQPDSGEVLIDGENIVPMNERQLLGVRRKFGMVFQGAALFDSMTVAENVAFGLRRHENLTEAKIPPNCRAACASGWDWRAQSFTNRKLCFMMSRRRGWTRLCPTALTS
jgi:phospholipid/cholesterol/gamma-HCH transport system ATP-binding protein